jgi:hypothetical protein
MGLFYHKEHTEHREALNPERYNYGTKICWEVETGAAAFSAVGAAFCVDWRAGGMDGPAAVE